MKMDKKKLKSTIEAILFAAGEPVPEARISLVLGVPEEDVADCGRALSGAYERGERGMRVLRLDGKLQMCSAPDYAQDIIKTMTDSAFKNPNGLDEDGHYSTARDMAKLADYCMQNADFRALVSCKSRTMGGRDYVNHNKLLWQLKGCLGVKTGYTLSSGRSLVSCCQRGGTRYLCVTLGDPDDWADHGIQACARALLRRGSAGPGRLYRRL